MILIVPFCNDLYKIEVYCGDNITLPIKFVENAFSTNWSSKMKLEFGNYLSAMQVMYVRSISSAYLDSFNKILFS